MVDYNLFMYCFIECVYILYRVVCEYRRESLWSLHASLFNVMQDLPETLESWQCLTWAVLITVMARILIKSLFTYPGALWSLSGAPVCSSTAASPVCVAMASLTQTAVPPSHSHGQHDEWRRTCHWTHPPRVQLSEIEVSHEAGKRQWIISEKVLLGLCFSGPAPNPSWTSRSPSQDCSWGCLMTPSCPFKLVQSKVQLVCNSTSNLWWGKACAWDSLQESCRTSQTGHERSGPLFIKLQKRKKRKRLQVYSQLVYTYLIIKYNKIHLPHFAWL